MLEAIGMIECSSIGFGFKAQDEMLKSADVNLVLARTICSGKYINVVTGSISPSSATPRRCSASCCR